LEYHQKITSQRDNLRELEFEDESLHLALLFAISQVESEELTAEERQIIEDIWEEVENFHQKL
jgi:hypothetical protein